MDEDDVVIGSGNLECAYMSHKQDCDGDYDTYCTRSNNSCPYQHNVKDCDGDIICLCKICQ